MFAFDSLNLIEVIKDKIKILKNSIKKDWKIKFYLYYNSEKDSAKNIIDRVEFCKNNKILPYVMRDKNYSVATEENKNFIIDYSAYCNQPNFFKKISFEDFLYKRTKNEKRISKTLEIFNTRF